MRVAELWRYPVKSLAGERLESAELTVNGIVGDRVVHVRDERGRVITARTHPRLLALHATLGPDGEPRLDGRPWAAEESAVAVVHHDRLVGLVMADDLAAARPSAATTLSIGEVRGALARIPVESIMRRDVATIVPDTPIAEAARLMRDGRGPLAVLAGDDLVGLVGAAELLSEVEREESR